MKKEEIILAQKYGLNYDAKGVICPFHHDTKGGSFSFFSQGGKMYYKCFSCGEVGTTYKLLIKMASQKDVIVPEQEKILLADKDTLTAKELKIRSKTLFKIKKTFGLENFSKEISLEDRKTLSFTEEEVYKLNIFYYGLLSKLSLKDDDRDYLVNRGLTINNIENNQYKSISYDDSDIIDSYIKDIEGEIFSRNELLSIPGVYLDEKSKELTFMSLNNAIIIPIKFDENIIALQLRFMGENVKTRYTWVSSASKNGHSSSSPLNNMGELNLDKPILLTEGHFKAITLKNFGFDEKYNIISCQGIGNISFLPKIMEKMNNKSLVIAFDKDVFELKDGENLSKLKQRQKQVFGWLDKLINKFDINVEFLSWDKNEKGIDDVLLNYDINDIKFIKKNKEEVLCK